MNAYPRPLVAGNWKMNGARASLAEVERIAKAYDAGLRDTVELLVCPPATLLFSTAALCLGSRVRVGAQDCHTAASGAHTGDLAAEMIADCGADFVIVGHSERRADHGESDATVRAKAIAAVRAGLTPIVCVGETQAQRRAGETLAVVGGQIDGSIPDGGPGALVVAYEPVWAIGTGLTPTTADVAEVHADIRAKLVGRFGDGGRSVRILYGGSVKPSNAAELMRIADVNGALVGGASLKSSDFMSIASVYRKG